MTIDGRGAQRELGRLVRLKARDVWPDEARDFTFWLRQNAALLGEALGLDIEIREAEVSVGGFNVDLVGEDLTRARLLIVENQLDATDHGHLGQLLTYASGLDAATIVWISPQFRDEHRQAIDWLNAHTDETVDFFGLQLEVVQIGDSLPAANLKPVATPNAWQQRGQQVVRQTEPGDVGLARQRFFEGALAELKRRQPGITNATRIGFENWLPLAAGRTGFSFWWWLTSDRLLRTCLTIDVGDPATNLAYFRALEARREHYEQRAGFALEWEPLEGRKSTRVGVSRSLAPGVPIESDDDLREWAVRTMLALNNAFRADVRALPVPSAESLAIADREDTDADTV